MSPKSNSSLSRKEFLKMGGMAAIAFSLQNILLHEHVYGMIKDRNGDKSLDEKMKAHVAVARAITDDPYKKYPQTFKNDGDKELRLAAAAAVLGNKAYLASDVSFPVDITSGTHFSDLLLNPDPGPLYKAATVGVPTFDFIKSFDTLDKDMTAFTGTMMSGATSLMMGLGPVLFKPISKELAVIGAVGAGISGMSSFMNDKTSQQIIGDNALQIVQALWNDPAAKKVMTKEVKNTLTEICGIDFDASVEENKKYLPDSVKNYVDIYLDNKGLTPEQLKQKEDETIKAITEGVNSSLQNAVGTAVEAIKQQQKDALDKQIEASYKEGEIKGAIYLATFLSDHFISPKASKIVSAVASSALKIASMIGAGAALGPVGLVAGCVMVALDLCGVFGKSGPSADELIMDAIGKVQDSINALHKDMIELFKDVFDNQEKMMERIDVQFELLKTKQDEALGVLHMVQQKIEVEFDAQKQHNRDEARQNLDSKVISLNTIINEKVYSKKKTEDVLDQATIKQAIETCYTFGMDTTRYGDFTGLPHPQEGQLHWDAARILQIFETSNLIDYSVGLVPLIVNRFAPQQAEKIGYINNPRGLGYAAAVMAIAYSVFPAVAKKYEIGKYTFSKDMSDAITGTKNSLLASVTSQIMSEFKESYLQIVEKLVEESLKLGEQQAYQANNIQKVKEDNITIAGPCIEITSREVVNLTSHLFTDVPQNAILEKDVFNREGQVKSNEEVINLGTFKVKSWKNVNYHDIAETTNTEDLFNLLEKLNLLQRESSLQQTRKCSEDIVLGDIVIGLGKFVSKYSGEETFTSTKMTISKPDGKIVSLGDATSAGWINSKISKQKLIHSIPKSGQIDNLPDISIQYVSNDILNDPNVGGSSSIFLDKLVENANVFYKLRKEIVENTQKIVTDNNNLLSLELEASAKCLKFLGGLNTYIRTGDINLGTAISKDLVPGINTQVSSSGNSSNDIANILVSTRHDVTDLIAKVASKEYLYDENHIASQGNDKMELKEYIKLEVKQIAGKSFDRYIAAYFSDNRDTFNLSELTIPQAMLSAASNIVRRKPH